MKAVVDLVTLFPGLRVIFISAQFLDGATSADKITTLWDRHNAATDAEWEFWRTLAVTCLSDTDISTMLEGCTIRQLAKCDEVGLSVTERLLIGHCLGASQSSSALGIRYLGGILDLPMFWLDMGSVHSLVARRLCQATNQILRDIGVDLLTLGPRENSEIPFDYDGVDSLATLILKGLSSWFTQLDQEDWTLQSWYPSFTELLHLLRRPRAAELVPTSSVYATTAFEHILPTFNLDAELNVVVDGENSITDNRNGIHDDPLADLNYKSDSTMSVHSEVSDEASAMSVTSSQDDYSDTLSHISGTDSLAMPSWNSDDHSDTLTDSSRMNLKVPRCNEDDAARDVDYVQAAQPHFEKKSSDWFVVHNPDLPRTVDVNLVHTFSHASVVTCVEFSADGNWLATGAYRIAQMFNVQSGARVCVLEHSRGDDYVRSVRFSPDGTFLATAAEDARIMASVHPITLHCRELIYFQIWDVAMCSICKVFDGHQGRVYCLDFSTDGNVLISGSSDRSVRIWDMDDGSMRVLAVSPDPEHVPASGSWKEGTDLEVSSVTVSPDGTLVAAGYVDAVIRIWSVATGALVEQLKGHRDSVYSVVFTRDGHGIVSGSLDHSLKYWDLSGVKVREEAARSSRCLTNFIGHKDYVICAAISQDSGLVVSGSKDKDIRFWDRSGTVQCTLSGHKNTVISVSISPRDNLLASGGGDSLVHIWSYDHVA
ncbi:putative TUP1-general transcription repressor [Mycena venus]|uniref:Putative TUP1-general transcription repressor n=1 Tax=Mycena venus TaxID=2733690 RepID=A0A8H6YLC3_9AGAR|nr:putative TUP1-general transcription repressor [Mycena venus]